MTDAPEARRHARANKSYGLTTLRDDHVRFFRDGRASFAFRGKSGRHQQVVLDDRRPVDSGMVNDYLRSAMCDNGEGFTAKDFRTWGATVRPKNSH